MALVFESDEEVVMEEMVDDDDEDDDYVPEKHITYSDEADDSDPHFVANNKRKSSISRRGRPSKSSPPRKKIKTNETTKKGRGRPRKNTPVKSPTVKKSPGLQRGRPRGPSKTKQKSDSDVSDDDSVVETSKPATKQRNSLRRSSRSTRTRVSYADADVSGEEHFQDSDFDELEDEVYTVDPDRRKKSEAEKKQHVENLWSSFKDNVNKPSTTTEDPVVTPEVKSKPVNDAIENSLEKNLPLINIDIEIEPLTDKNIITEKGVDKKEVFKTSTPVDEVEKSVTSADEEKAPEGAIKKSSSEDNVKSDTETEDVKRENVTDSETSKEKQKTCADIESVEDESIGKPVAENEDANKIDNQTSDKCKDPDDLDDDDNLGKKKDKDLNGEKESGKIIEDVKKTETDTKNKEPKLDSVQKSETTPEVSVSQELRPSSAGGMSSVLSSFAKKKKVSVLEKSKNDWDSFKEEQGISEELKSNRGVGYLDKQEFLNRVDYRQWENERDVRMLANRK